MVFGGFVSGAGWIDGSMTCNFNPVLKVFQSYHDDVSVIMTGYAQYSPLYVQKISAFIGIPIRDRQISTSALKLLSYRQGQCVLVLKHQLRWIEFH